MKDFGVTAIACTPSYLLHIAEVLEEAGDIPNIKLKAAVCGAEPWTENMRKQIEAKLHINAFDIYGLSEVMGPGAANTIRDFTYMRIISCRRLLIPIHCSRFRKAKSGN